MVSMSVIIKSSKIMPLEGVGFTSAPRPSGHSLIIAELDKIFICDERDLVAVGEGLGLCGRLYCSTLNYTYIWFAFGVWHDLKSD